MARQKLSGIAMIEPLESRQLFSASVATIEADLATLQAAVTTQRIAITTLKTDLLSTIPAGTAGRGALVRDLKAIHAVAKSSRATITADLTAIIDATGNPSAKAAAVATLKTDVDNFSATFKADLTAAKAVIAKHPTLISADVKLTTDEAAVQGDYQAVKADLVRVVDDLT